MSEFFGFFEIFVRGVGGFMVDLYNKHPHKQTHNLLIINTLSLLNQQICEKRK